MSQFVSYVRPMVFRHTEDVAQLSGKIYSFIGLRDGWHYGGGRACSLQTANKAIQLANTLQAIGAERINAFPELDGEVMVNSDLDGSYFEFVCADDGYVEVSREDDDDEGERIAYLQLIEKLRSMPWNPNISSVWSTHDTMTKPAEDLYHLRSVDPDRTRVSRSSTQNAVA